VATPTIEDRIAVASAVQVESSRDKSLRELAEAERQKTLKRLNAYRSFFESASGRDVLQCLRESCDGNTFRPDPYESAYAAGRRSVYLGIIEALDAAQLAELIDKSAPERVANLQSRAELPATIEEL
jgi:hypothetical protein